MKGKRAKKIVLEPRKRSSEVLDFEQELKGRIVGQEDAVSALVAAYQTVIARMANPDRPIANFLFLGPTGSGKTRSVEAAAEILFGSPKCVLKIDCAEYQHAHEVAKLIGAPPGYIGHAETRPILSQEAVDQFQTTDLKMTFVLFDEIEKANDALWRLLLGILDKGTLTLGDNRKVDLSRTVIVMTSNLGASEMTRLLSGGMGFAPQSEIQEDSRIDRKLSQVAIDAARKRFSPEFMNRLDRVVVFQALNRTELREILEIELYAVQRRILIACKEHVFALHYENDAKDLLLREGTDPKYGARPLKRAIDKHLVQPLTSLISTGQIGMGDIVNVDVAGDGLSLEFTKEEAPSYLHSPLPAPATAGFASAGAI